MHTLGNKMARGAAVSLLVAGLMTSAMAAKKAPAMAKMGKAHGMMVKGKMAGKPHAGKPTQVTGTVVSVSGTSLTIKPAMSKNGHNKTIQVPATANVMLGKRPEKLSSIQPGQKLTAYMNATGVVTRVVVVTKAAAAHKMIKGGSKMSGSKMGGKMHPGSKMSGGKKM